MGPNLVPRFILERHAAGERQGRFAAASLFVDISGFGAVTNALLEHSGEAAEAMAGVRGGSSLPRTSPFSRRNPGGTHQFRIAGVALPPFDTRFQT
jgi:hypothetical protein